MISAQQGINMPSLEQFGKYVLYAIAFVLICILSPLVVISICAVIALILALGFICWMCGLPIAITQDKHTIGYVRWFKFYRE